MSHLHILKKVGLCFSFSLFFQTRWSHLCAYVVYLLPCSECMVVNAPSPPHALRATAVSFAPLCVCTSDHVKKEACAVGNIRGRL